jgi:hypothetical protein
MARQSSGVRRKLVQFDEETWRALDLLMRDQMKSFDEVAAEAFRDLLRKHGQPENLKAALKESARAAHHSSHTRPKRGKPRSSSMRGS